MQDLFVVFVQDPVNASVNLPKLGWPLNEASKDEVLLFGADAKVTQIENGALNQSLCAQVAAYEGSISGDVDTGQA
jgi:hypothetical protein